jgi:hypothetical protein
MMTIEIRVNGNLVVVINAVNRGYTGRTPNDCTYEWTAAEWPMELGTAPRASIGTVAHDRGAGIVKLSELLCGAFNAKRQTSSRSKAELTRKRKERARPRHVKRARGR